MAFCPNCGTPNTDQAAKCVSCAFELAPAQKAKFKGTIMMSGVQTPQAPQAAQPQPAPAPAAPPANASAPAASPPQSSRNMAFEKTIMGPMAGVSPISAPPSAADPRSDLARAATVEGPAPQFTPPPQAPAAPQAASSASASSAAIGGGYASSGYGDTGNFGGGGGYGGDDGAPPTLPKPNTGKILAIGCAVVLAMSCLIGGVMYFMAKKQISAIMGGGQDEEGTLAWRGTLSQALAQVSALCASNCEGAANYFHPSVQVTLVSQAKQLTPARLQKLVNPAESEGAMLNATDDGSLATNLGLDPQLCVRIVSGTAKVIGCSVPNPAGPADMRIVHLSGLETL